MKCMLVRDARMRKLVVTDLLKVFILFFVCVVPFIENIQFRGNDVKICTCTLFLDVLDATRRTDTNGI